MWRCPLCQQPLQQSMRTWRCDNRHAFDEAKSGYLNLLPVQNKKSKQPGDDKTMVNARRQFHDAKGYEPLMAALVSRLPSGPGLPLLADIPLLSRPLRWCLSGCIFQTG